MKALTLATLLAFAGSLWVTSPARAKCEMLYDELQSLIHQAEREQRDPLFLAHVRQCTEEGIKRHGQNRHWESMKTLRRCLELLASGTREDPLQH